MKQPSRIPFRWVLPIAQFILCATLLWPFMGDYITQVHNVLHGYFPELVDREEIVIHSNDPNHANESSARSYGEWRLLAPALLNMPVVLTGLARRETVPTGFVAEWWRALTWPIVGLIFWWLAGRGIEALLAARSHLISPALTWAEAIVAALICICMGVILMGLTSRMTTVACFLWLILGLATVGARVLQWRMRADVRSEPAAPTVHP